MPFIDFLYANLNLTAPAGSEDKVAEIRAYRGQSHISACYNLSPEELAEINKTGVIWLSMLGHKWPPVQLSPWIPQHRADAFADLRVYGDPLVLMVNRDQGEVVPLFYLDLALLFVKLPNDYQDFIFRERKDINQLLELGLPEGTPVYDLEYRERTAGVHTSGGFYFSQALQILGRYKDLARLEPLKYLFPFLQKEETGDYLVLAPKDPPAPSKTGQILTLN